jgi:hypothetical protein
VEVLELLAQGEHTVDALARATGMGVTNTSAHLQVLRRAGLVESQKRGTQVWYRLAGDDVASFVVSLRDLARSRLAEVDRVVRDYFVSRDSLEPHSRADLIARAERGEIVILDVRPSEEFAAGHIPGALSVPLNRLDENLSRLPDRRLLPWSLLRAGAAGGRTPSISRVQGTKASGRHAGVAPGRIAGCHWDGVKSSRRHRPAVLMPLPARRQSGCTDYTEGRSEGRSRSSGGVEGVENTFGVVVELGLALLQSAGGGRA